MISISLFVVHCMYELLYIDDSGSMATKDGHRLVNDR